MRLFTSPEFNSLEDVFCEQLEDLYDAEKRLTQALPKMAEAAHSEQLKQGFEHHLRQTEAQVSRLEQVFQQLGKKPQRETCDGMKGLIQEGEEFVQAKGNPDVKDAALIAAAQRVEHYEIAAYGSLKSLAHKLGHHEAARLLEATFDEEVETDQKLTQLSEQSVVPQAQHA